MADVHLIDAEKGGVGKSLVARPQRSGGGHRHVAGRGR